MAGAKTVFMFSGQGSQYLQMGRALFQSNPIFRASMLEMDRKVRDLAGVSVVDTLYAPTHGPGDKFDRTLLTHPAIFMIECSLAHALRGAGVVPDLVLGVSLGSFAAAAVGGFLTQDDALVAVVRQAQVLEEHCEPGGMVAILDGADTYEQEPLRSACELAAVNLPSHFVVSAPDDRCAIIERHLRAKQVPWQRLPVSFAFHSRWIDSARVPFERFLRTLRIGAGELPLVCSDRAEILTTLHRGYFWDVARRPIRFRQAIDALERTGSYRYVDVGPAGTLATFLKYGLQRGSGSTIHSVLSPFGNELQSFSALAERPR